MTMALDVVAFLERATDDAIDDEFCGTLLSSDGKRYCGCSANHP